MFKLFLKFLGVAVLVVLGIDLIIYLAISINFASLDIADWSEKAREGFAVIRLRPLLYLVFCVPLIYFLSK